MTEEEKTSTPRPAKVRYGVVGLGYISQAAMLPAFAHAHKNSELTALVSGDRAKLEELGRRYGVPNQFTYAEYDDLLHSGLLDAVYIALPNNLHREYAIRAARAGIHVLCEKPMAVTEDDCKAMIQECEEHNVRLMIAYRLHFEEANLKAMDIVRAGKLGEPRIFSSVFTMQVRPGDIRLRRELGGGTLYDIGIYCINAVRSLFQDEPEEVYARSIGGTDPRFSEVDEMTSAVLRFPKDRLAAFTSSFDATDVATYQVVGTQGSLRMEDAYGYANDIIQRVTVGGRTREHIFRKRDQFAPELIYFSNCVLAGEDPEPSGWEGLADVRVIRALYESAATHRPIELESFRRYRYPDISQEITRPPIREPALVHAREPAE